MANVLRKDIKKTLQRSYTIKIDDYSVNLSSAEEVIRLLRASLQRFDLENEYDVELTLDPNRELNVLSANVYKKATVLEEEKEIYNEGAGIESVIDEMFDQVEPEKEKEFSDFELGLVDLSYSDTVEVVESYLLDESLTMLEEAVEVVTKEQEKNQIYDVVAGDTLSGIAENNNLTVEKLIELNKFADEFVTIRVGDELIITIPEPELSVVRKEEMYYEETYDADVIYVDNESWYTTQTKILQEPSSGYRKVVAVVSFRNEYEMSREILKQEVVMEAVPKIVERGTITPPTYIKPISGGRLTSGFGKRSAPTRGASTYHKGVDWSIPTGTSVFASSGGTVAKAGWASGYGYVVYINHADGRQTRYGHLSKVLVKSGQYVSQGDKIALSGNSGISTGPHLHFEILINGVQVNPLKYLD
jgi:murein DD-endopeptidase MepM/ murein hydrolase activator NlpD